MRFLHRPHYLCISRFLLWGCFVLDIVCLVRTVFFCYFSSLSVFSLVFHPFHSLSLLLLCSFHLIFFASKFAFRFHFVFHCRAISSSLTKLTFSKLLKVSITVSLPCDVTISDVLNSLSSEGDCPRLDLLFLLLPSLVRLKCCFGEKNFN